MARNLTSIPDIQAPDADYPVGRIQNEDAPIVGTPIIEELYGDPVQFFHKLLRLAGITHNGLPENETYGFQFIEALAYYVRTLQATEVSKGTLEIATQSEVDAGMDTSKAVVPAYLISSILNIFKSASYSKNNHSGSPLNVTVSSDVGYISITGTISANLIVTIPAKNTPRLFIINVNADVGYVDCEIRNSVGTAIFEAIGGAVSTELFLLIFFNNTTMYKVNLTQI